MATGLTMLNRVKSVNLAQMAADVANNKLGSIRDKQIKQLMAGLNSEGNPLAPSILDDPYFKSRTSAEKYAKWKKRMFPETPYGAPNLIITGVFHGSISLRRAGAGLSWFATAQFAGSIANKYHGKELGLNADSKHEVWVEDIRTDLIRDVSKKTGIKIR